MLVLVLIKVMMRLRLGFRFGFEFRLGVMLMHWLGEQFCLRFRYWLKLEFGFGFGFRFLFGFGFLMRNVLRVSLCYWCVLREISDGLEGGGGVMPCIDGRRKSDYNLRLFGEILIALIPEVLAGLCLDRSGSWKVSSDHRGNGRDVEVFGLFDHRFRDPGRGDMVMVRGRHIDGSRGGRSREHRSRGSLKFSDSLEG